MGLFGKKERVESKVEKIPSLPDLPKLPTLNDFPSFEEKETSLPQLPTFPKNELGERFSRNTIKEAVNGKKEMDEEEIYQEDDFAEEPMQRIQESPIRVKEPLRIQEPPVIANRYTPQKPLTRQTIPVGFEEAEKVIKGIEPIFVRIDKFEESKKMFQKTKEQVSEIEKALEDIKEIKEQEDKELTAWQQQISEIKDKISKIERDIFSKS
jgi:CRISPR/Cas system CSM-associated protein Csm4 (group 5 of RAMP superfamily)